MSMYEVLDDRFTSDNLVEDWIRSSNGFTETVSSLRDLSRKQQTLEAEKQKLIDCEEVDELKEEVLILLQTWNDFSLRSMKADQLKDLNEAYKQRIHDMLLNVQQTNLQFIEDRLSKIPDERTLLTNEFVSSLKAQNFPEETISKMVLELEKQADNPSASSLPTIQFIPPFLKRKGYNLVFIVICMVLMLFGLNCIGVGASRVHIFNKTAVGSPCCSRRVLKAAAWSGLVGGIFALFAGIFGVATWLKPSLFRPKTRTIVFNILLLMATALHICCVVIAVVVYSTVGTFLFAVEWGIFGTEVVLVIHIGSLIFSWYCLGKHNSYLRSNDCEAR